MNSQMDLSSIHINDLYLWAHVGVLSDERLLGQRFKVDIVLWIDVNESSKKDDVSFSIDYSIAIKGLQKLVLGLECLTIEAFSSKILDFLETLYGKIPMQIYLQKCNPPLTGFTGNIAIKRSRNKYQFNK